MNTKINRRHFLRATSNLGIALTATKLGGRLVPLGLGLATGSEAEAALNLNVVTDKLLILDSGAADWLISYEGGSAVAEVIAETPTPLVKKHIANLRYQDMVVSVGANISSALKEWIQLMLGNEQEPLGGMITSTDSRGNAISSLAFKYALISEVGLPALDARSRNTAFLTLKLAPETTLRSKPAGKPSLPPYSPNRKRWLASNFRLGFDGDSSLSKACSRVSKVEAMTVKQAFNGQEFGESREPIKRGHLEISNLVVTLPEAFAEPFYAWHQSFVIEGVNSDKDEKSVTLEYLAQDLKETLFTLKLLNVGIISVTPVPAGSADQLSQVRVEMYCEQISFN
jgi:hypothetical protein